VYEAPHFKFFVQDHVTLSFTSSSNNIHVIQLYANKKPSCHWDSR